MRCSAEKALEAEKKKSEEVVAENSELAKRLEACCKLQVDLKEAANERNESYEAVVEKLRASEVEVKGLKFSLEEKDHSITTLLEKTQKEKMDVEARNRAIEEDCKKTIEMLMNKNEAWEKEKKEMMEQVTLKELENDEVNQTLFQENKDLEAQIEKLEMEKTRLVLKWKEGVESALQLKLMNNAILATPDAHVIQGNIKNEVYTPRPIVYALRSLQM